MTVLPSRSTQTVAAETRASSRGERQTAGLLALVLGGLFIAVVGFAQVDAIHNAAHDGRHSFAFPCH